MQAITHNLNGGEWGLLMDALNVHDEVAENEHII